VHKRSAGHTAAALESRRQPQQDLSRSSGKPRTSPSPGLQATHLHPVGEEQGWLERRSPDRKPRETAGKRGTGALRVLLESGLGGLQTLPSWGVRSGCGWPLSGRQAALGRCVDDTDRRSDELPSLRGPPATLRAQQDRGSGSVQGQKRRWSALDAAHSVVSGDWWAGDGADRFDASSDVFRLRPSRHTVLRPGSAPTRTGPFRAVTSIGTLGAARE